MKTNDDRQAALDECIGQRYDSVVCNALFDNYDWDGVWPVIDGNGCLTGMIIDCDTPGDWANVDNLAMVDISDLPDAEQARINEDGRCWWDGYADL